MPLVTVNNKNMTNINLGGGYYVMGISKNPNDDVIGGVTLAGDAMEKPHTRPLRYTPGLKCDAHLESLRPEREGKHPALQVSTYKHHKCSCWHRYPLLVSQGGDEWKKRLVQPPNTFEGSFVEADMQKFRPEPVTSATEDPWYASRCPDQSMAAFDRLSNPAATYGFPELPMSGPYGTMYPQVCES